MKRVVAAALLLSAAITLAVWSSITFRREMEILSYSLENLIEISADSSDEDLKDETQKLMNKWDNSSKLLHSLVVHEGMDELEETITALPLILTHSTKEEFTSKCIEAVNIIKNLIESERLNIGNVL